ncbi:hypothetical protein ALC53_02743 [Atta colombica]|uniref:Uncharacterized protein n=1 Tax=Atta colombica TaxID=520822 RepID=A0A195BQM1_9HYME|nr:hypothetical protein ALC53_02743 [Atta colombica]
MLYYLTVNSRHSGFQYSLTIYNIEQIMLKNSGVLKNDSWGIGSGTNAVVQLTFNWNTMSSICRQQIFQLPTLPEPFVGNNVHFEEKIAYLATAISSINSVAFFGHFTFQLTFTELNMRAALSVTHAGRVTGQSVPFVRDRALVNEHYPTSGARYRLKLTYTVVRGCERVESEFRVATRHSVVRVHCGDARSKTKLLGVPIEIMIDFRGHDRGLQTPLFYSDSASPYFRYNFIQSPDLARARITPRFALKWCMEKRREEREAELCQEICLRTWRIIAWTSFIRITQNSHLEKLYESDNLQKLAQILRSSFSLDSSEAHKPKWVHQNRFSSELSVCLRIPKDETIAAVFMRQKCVVLEIPRFLVENPMIFHFSIFFHRALALFSRGLFSEQYTTIWSLTKPENRLIIAGGEVWILELDRYDAGIRSFEYSGLTQMIISGGVSTLPGLFRECHG